MPLESPDAANDPWSPTERSVPGRLWGVVRGSPIPLVCGAAFGLALLGLHFEVAFLDFETVDVADSLRFAVLHTSLYVMGIWALLGTGSCVLRSMAAMATIVSSFIAEAAVLLAIAPDSSTSLLNHVQQHRREFEVLEVLALCVALATLRILGVRLCSGRPPDPSPGAHAPWQFQVRGLLVITLLWSAFFACALHWPMSDMQMVFGEIASVVIIVGNLWPLVILIAICSRPPLALAAFAATGFLFVVEMAMFVRFLIERAGHSTGSVEQTEVTYMGLSLLSYFICITCVVVGAASLLRLAGYRIEPVPARESNAKGAGPFANAASA
jgi:hypothetical protein